MKYSIAGIMVAASMCLAGTALAYGPGHHRSHHSHHYHRSSADWLVPALVGGAVVYAITRPTVVVQEQPRVVQVPPAPPGYHYETVLDANCNCYRTVLVNN